MIKPCNKCGHDPAIDADNDYLLTTVAELLREFHKRYVCEFAPSLMDKTAAFLRDYDAKEKQ